MSKMGYREKCLAQKINVCAVCGSSEDLVVHHIDGDRSNNSLDNLTPVCTSCHGSIHHGMGCKSEILQSYQDKLPDSAIHKGPYSKNDYGNLGVKSELKCNTILNKDGWLTIPKISRQVLGIDGKKANLTLEISINEELTDE